MRTRFMASREMGGSEALTRSQRSSRVSVSRSRPRWSHCVPDSITAVLSPCLFPPFFYLPKRRHSPQAEARRERRVNVVLLRPRNQSPTGGSRKQRPYLIPSATYHRSKKRNGLLVLPALAMNGDLNREAASLVHSPKKKADV
ncbi:hypothetical protein B296_00051774 [Ensete ventricosum]|uniref:Uncharacterized protein n=1 Tax=Ensete ventricosum TaxID=4639 RepID=A0A426X069_ENSVE|nr:hypothetical protein B296_00051774 [Ensete ventricosum]